jgi:hypothetical protein
MKNINKGYNIPNCLEIKQSSLHGLGVFATKPIKKNSNLGICHYYVWNPKQLSFVTLRNPLVGLINYSTDKNGWLPIRKKEFKNGRGMVTELITTKDIQKGEEVLLKYNWYDPTKPDTKDNKHYIPLPGCVSIEKRNNVYVLYATTDIVKDFNFGPSYCYYKATDQYEPNPLGGYLVEQNNPNCKLIKENKELYLISKEPIKKGEVISVNYESI